MIDRFGNPIRIGFADHEILWIKAALTLPRRDHMAAYEDIADLTGRTLVSICSKASKIRALIAEEDRKRRAFVPSRRISQDRAASALAPSIIAPLTKARLMGSRA